MSKNDKGIIEKKGFDCLNCHNCELNKVGNYICHWKKCNMGKAPFYNDTTANKPKKFYKLGFCTCYFKPKTVQKTLL